MFDEPYYFTCMLVSLFASFALFKYKNKIMSFLWLIHIIFFFFFFNSNITLSN